MADADKLNIDSIIARLLEGKVDLSFVFTTRFRWIVYLNVLYRFRSTLFFDELMFNVLFLRSFHVVCEC